MKLRGIRIEPGEIEGALLTHPAVDAAAVVAQENDVSGKYLAAYVVTSEGARPAPEELRAHLAHLLPSAMLPSAFIHLDHLPVTRNGKLDRAALPIPQAPEQGSEGDTNLSEVESRLSEIVTDVLHQPQINKNANFFLAGGHSLLATQVVLRSREAFDVDVSLRDLFDAPTIETFASVIEERLLSRIGALSEAELAALSSAADARK